jgi:hypothetical protein
MKFWPSRKKEKLGRSLSIPKEHQREFLVLQDTYVREYGESKHLHLAQYDLWEFIYKIFPETREGRWEVPHLRSWNDSWVVVEIVEE